MAQRPGPLTLAGLLLAACAAPATGGLRPIFDGTSLDGWEVLPASSTAAWRVEDGVIVAEGDGARSYLTYEDHELADFELELEYRFRGEGNSGVSLRARPDPTGRRAWVAYHADLGQVGIGDHILGAWDFHTPGRREHGCRRGYALVIDEHDDAVVTPLENPVTRQDLDPGGWNRLRVVARGERFELYLNRKLSSVFTEHLPPERRLESGMLQLQLHDPEMVVHFRNVRLRELD